MITVSVGAVRWHRADEVYPVEITVDGRRFTHEVFERDPESAHAIALQTARVLRVETVSIAVEDEHDEPEEPNMLERVIAHLTHTTDGPVTPTVIAGRALDYAKDHPHERDYVRDALVELLTSDEYQVAPGNTR